MKHPLFWLISLFFLFVACTSTPPTAVFIANQPTATFPAVITFTPSPTITPSPTPTPSSTPDRVATALAQPTRTPSPTFTPTITFTPSPTFTPNPTLPPFVSPIDLTAGVTFEGAVLAPDNVDNLQKLNSWGKGRVIWASYSPDGSQVAVLTPQKFYLYQAGSDNEIYTIPAPAGQKFISAAASSDWQWLALGLNNEQIAIYKLVDGAFQYQLPQKHADIIQFFPNSTILLTQLWGWDVATNQAVSTKFPGGVISADGQTVVFSAEGRFFISELTWEDNQLKMPPLRRLTIENDSDFVLAPDGSKLAMGGGVIEVWDLESQTLLYKVSLQFPEETIPLEANLAKGRRFLPAQRSGPGRYYGVAVAFSPDGKWLITTHGDGDLLFFDAETGEFKQRWVDAAGEVSFTADMSKLLSWRDAVTEWSLAGDKLFEYVNHQSWIYDVAFTPQNNLVLGVDDLLLLNIPQLQPQTHLDNPVTQLALTNNGETVVYFYYENLFFYHLPTGRLTSLPNKEEDSINQFFISPDEQWFAFTHFYKGGQVWSLNNWSQYLNFFSYPENETVTFTPDSQYFIYPDNDLSEIGFWSLADPSQTPTRPVFTLPIPEDVFIARLTISPTGQQLIAQTRADNNDISTLFIYNLQTQAIEATFEVEAEKMEFTPDGQLLVMINNNRFMLWRTSDWSLVREIELGRVYNFAISPDGQLLALAFFDGHLELWGIPQP